MRSPERPIQYPPCDIHDQLVYVIDDLHSAALELDAAAAYRLHQLLGYAPDELPSGADLRARLRKVIR